MKTLFIILLIVLPSRIFAQTICNGQQLVPTETFNQCNNDPYWVLVFEDEFNGNSLDLSKWSYGPRIRYCNDEQQYYTSGNNIVVSNGTIKLIAKKETIYANAVDGLPANEHLYCTINGVQVDRGQNARYFYYTSENIETVKKFSYGKFEARIKIPKGKGFWPAFWTYGGNPWNEIDIFEFWNENNVYNNYDQSKLSRIHHMTTHYDYDNDGNDNKCETNYTGVDFSQDFHIFTIIWERNKIEWYVDGQLKRTDYRYYTILGQVTGCTINAGMEYMLNKIYPIDSMALILNLAIQYGYDKYGNNMAPDNTTPFPSQMEVDWVRYYQRKPYQDFYVTGASTICSSNSTYTLHNRPTGSTISWSHSDNLIYINGQGTNNYTVKAKNIIGSTSDQGWVEANVNGITKRKTIGISRYPSIPIIHIPIEPINCQYNAMVWASDNPDDITYTWDINNGTIISHNNEELVVKPNCPPSYWHRPYYLYLKVIASNGCGSSSASKTVQISNGGIINPLNVTVYPNPTKGILNINIHNTGDNGSLNIEKKEIFLYNRMMAIVKHKENIEDKSTLILNDLQPDIYILKIIIGEKFYYKIIILTEK